MLIDDTVRELEKIKDALEWAEKYLTTMNESNAALHLNQKVFYSPLTTMIHEAVGSAGFLIGEVNALQQEYQENLSE